MWRNGSSQTLRCTSRPSLSSTVLVWVIGIVSAFILSLLSLKTSALSPAVVTESFTRQSSSGRYGSSTTSSASATSQDKNCIIVGGGPIGLATALTLARSPHYYNITLLEATSDLTSVYNPSKSFLYNLNARGLDWFMNPTLAPQSAYEQLQQKGYTPGIGSMGNFFVVPADPSQSVPNAKQINMVRPSTNKKKEKSSSPRRPGYWITRLKLNEIFYNCCQEHNDNNNAKNTNNDGTAVTTFIQVNSGKAVCALHPNIEDTNLISVQCQDGSTYTGSLIVAADGINSIVRSTLAGLVKSQLHHPTLWLQSNNKKFRVKKYISPSTGLKFKALQFASNLIIPNSTTTIVDHHNSSSNNQGSQYQSFVPQSTDIISVRGMNTGFRNRLSLGFLPMKDPNMIRLGNTIAPYDHEIWSLQNGSDAKQWFTQTFPRLSWNDSIIIDDNEWDRYVQTRSTTFPHCQYSPGSAVSSPNGLCGVVMVGDACHAFPPDIAQGVNAGLQDVVALDRALRNVDIVRGDDDDDVMPVLPARSLGTALLAYEKNRSPEHAALIRMARFGSPFQYRQPWLRHRIGAMIWTMNFLFRTVMNKLTLGFIPPAIIILASDQSLTFRQVMRRADTSVFGFQFLLWTCFIRWIMQRWSLNKILLVGVPVEVWAACFALIVLKGILPFQDRIESFLRREKDV